MKNIFVLTLALIISNAILISTAESNVKRKRELKEGDFRAPRKEPKHNRRLAKNKKNQKNQKKKKISTTAPTSMPTSIDTVGSTIDKVKLLVRYKNRDGFSNLHNDDDITITMEESGLNVIGIETIPEKVPELRQDPNIKYVDIDHDVQAFGWRSKNERVSPQEQMRMLAENTPWGIKKVLENKLNFFNDKIPTGDIKVCVADTGYDLGHEDLPDGDGVTGVGDKWKTDKNGHGTHCSGTVAAKGNKKGVLGVIPKDFGGNFQLVIGKALNDNGSGSVSTVMKAVQNCVKEGAKIISMSLGCNNCKTQSEQSFYEDLYSQGILIVAAAGNSGNSGKSYPASYSTVISVASIKSNEKRSDFSQFNSQVELSAPGEGVKSTTPGNKYDTWSGTSMATPHVAGVAGLLWMFFPKCKNYQIRNVMAATAKDLDDDGCDEKTGFGLVQAIQSYNELKKGNCGGDLGAKKGKGGCAQLDNNEPPTNATPSPTAAVSIPETVGSSNILSFSQTQTFYPTQSSTVFQSFRQSQAQSSFSSFYGSFSGSGNTGFIDFKVELKTDAYPDDIYYDLLDSQDKVFWVHDYVDLNRKANKLYVDEISLRSDDCYSFMITDNYGDGVCCSEGDGYVNVYIDGKKTNKIKTKNFKDSREIFFGDYCD